MYRNFICYRGGSSAGILIAEDIYNVAKKEEKIVGKTYYSLCKEDQSEIRNFLNDPRAYLGTAENVILLLTRDFFEGFIIDGKPNENSVTRIEIDEALKNDKLKFIPVVFPDFSWENETGGILNKYVIAELWGEDAMRRIVGSPPIQFVYAYKKAVIEQIVKELGARVDLIPDANVIRFDGTFKLESTPTVIPKRIFLGREEELKQITEIFDSGERVLFLQGIGGIGKTEIAKQYAKRNKDKYDIVIYATFNSTILELVSSQSSFKIEPLFIRKVNEDGSQESDLSFFERKLDLIRSITNERTLIIIDNFDVMDDDHFYDLLEANYKLLITTRCDYSRLYPTIKIEPLDNIEQLKRVFLDNYDGYLVDDDDPRLGELIELVNRHTYTIELIAQHMENSGQTVDEMIDVLKKQGIVSLNEEIRSSTDKTRVAYENLLRMFKVFNLSDEEKHVLKFLSMMPLSGVDIRDLRNWLELKSLKVIKDLENKSWVIFSSNGLALHPIIREVVRYELPISEEEAAPILKSFNETIKEEKSWHYSITTKSYYADIASEIIGIFNKINEHTVLLYKNVEILFSFSVKPARAVELASELFKYYASTEGEKCYMCGYASFQAGWTYLFNFHVANAVEKAKEWFDKSYEIFSVIELHNIDEFAAYGHLLSHLCRVYLLRYEETKDEALLAKAKEYGELTIKNAEAHFTEKDCPYHSRLAVAYMQHAEVYIERKEYDEALKLLDRAYEIMSSLFGEDDPDPLNVASRKSVVLFNMGRYEEALTLGLMNLEAYTRFYGELNYLRFEQLVIILKCYKELGREEQFKITKEAVLNIGKQLLPENSKKLIEISEM